MSTPPNVTTTVRTEYLPQVTFAPRTQVSSAAQAPREVLERTAQPASAAQLMLAAENAPLRVIYGRCMVGAQLVQAITHQGKLLMLCRWGKASIDAIEQIYFDNVAMPGNVVATHYLGGAHAPNAALVAAWAAQRPAQVYADAPAGTAYSVFVVPAGVVAGVPRIMARIRGRKLLDDRSGAVAWSDNPGLILADFLRDTTGYGMGLTLDSASVIAAANACDELVSSERRRTLGLALEEPQEAADWVETLRAYAGCFVVRDGDHAKLVPDRPAATVGTLSSAAGQIRAVKRLSKRGLHNVPTVVIVTYTDTSSTPWRESRVMAKAPGVATGATPWRESLVSLPGIQRRSQATREAIERLNKFRLQDLGAEIECMDVALPYETGDVIEVTHPLGLTAKRMRVLATARAGSRPVLTLEEYDPAVYSDDMAPEPTWSDTELPTPNNPTAPSNLVLAEEVYQLDSGLYASRIAATWTGVATSLFFREYRVVIRAGAVIVAQGVPTEPQYRSPAIQEGVQYQVDVSTISSLGVESAIVSALITAQGKQLAPGNVPGWITAFEAGGRVYLTWQPALDIDITRYEIRRGPTSGDFATATLIDRVDGLNKVVEGEPAGTWRYYVVARDSVGQLSPVPLTRDITVTLDAAAFLVGSNIFTAPALTNMLYQRPDRAAPGYWITDFGDALGYGHADTNDATGTSADLASVVYASPHTAGTATWLSESWPLGQALAGDWLVTSAHVDLVGTAVVTLQLSDNGSTWTDHAGGAAKASAGYARVKIETTGAMTVPEGGVSVAINAVARAETGIVTTAASGATTVTLAGHYAAVKTIQLTASGTVARTVTYDDVVIGAGANSFDIYCFNAVGVQVAADVAWKFEGI